MPHMNGIEVVAKIREFYKNFQLDLDFRRQGQSLVAPMIVVVTSFATPSFKKHMKDLGVECYAKPMEES
jgi:CheY-like chemotaxis protein